MIMIEFTIQLSSIQCDEAAEKGYIHLCLTKEDPRYCDAQLWRTIALAHAKPLETLSSPP